jgi:hypothetical protein
MRAIEQAKQLALEMGVSFEKQLAEHLAYGIVVSNDGRFGMARPITRDDPDNLQPTNPDCWLITCIVGKEALPWFLSILPYPLPHFAWRRHYDPSNRLRCYNAASVKRLIQVFNSHEL